MKVLVIIPTYNELDNVKKMIPEILDNNTSFNLLIVDDNSPDGTGKLIESLTASEPRLHLLSRDKKRGLGTAYVAGFRYAIANGYDVIIQMDADFSHDPKELKKFIEYIEKYDLVIGSRYIQGVNVVNWPISRLLLSYFANLYTRVITGLPIHDGTGGFKCFRKEVLQAIDLNEIRSNGYSFQIEMNYKAWIKGFKLYEFPITFVDRMQGKSKMSRKIVYEAIFMVWKLRIKHILGILK